MDNYGIVVGADSTQENLLPWWWSHYCKHNSYPVAFVDFGMSQTALTWCREKGRCINLPSYSYLVKDLKSDIKNLYNASSTHNLEKLRLAWFKKPWACLYSPFLLSCWIDLDCEIKGSLEPLFQTLTQGVDIALVKEPEYIQEGSKQLQIILPNEICYNSGVIAFRQDSMILHHWIDIAFSKNEEFTGDQDALSRAICLYQPSLYHLNPIYNWKVNLGINPEAVILHYIGAHKKDIKLNTLYSDAIE